MEKNKQIQQIAEKMKLQGISFKDIANAIPTHLFDLRCNINGNQVRLPFEQGRNHEVIGIYPFFNIDFYIYTHEGTEEMRGETYMDKLIPTAMWRCLFQLKDELNLCLSELNLPILDGNYFACDDYDVIVDFSQKHIKYQSENYYAKARYCDWA